MVGMSAASVISLAGVSRIEGAAGENSVATKPADCSSEIEVFSTGGAERGAWWKPQPQVCWLCSMDELALLAFAAD